MRGSLFPYSLLTIRHSQRFLPFEGGGAPKGACRPLSAQPSDVAVCGSGRGRAPRRQKCTQSAHLICVRGALAFRRFARGTRHRLLPRWISSRPLFPGTWQSARSENHAPAKTAKRVFCPPSPVPVQRAPRGPVVVPDDGAPEPPGNGLQNRARAPHSLRFQECPREGVPHERDLPKVAERGTFVKISSRYQ